MDVDVLSGRAVYRCAVARAVRLGRFSGGAAALGIANNAIQVRRIV